MFIKLLRRAHSFSRALLSFFRLLLPRLLGLRTSPGLQVASGINWPLGNLGNLELGENVSLNKNGWFYLPLDNREARIRIGSGTAIGHDFVITSNNLVEIGRNCLLSYRVTVMDHGHVTGRGVAPTTSGLTKGKPVNIGDNCFLGCNVVIMPGVTLGPNCIVGANAVVTKSFEAGSVIAGAPAKLLRSL